MNRRNRGRRRTISSLGINSIVALAAGRPVFTADRYTVDGVSGKVAAFVDWSDPTHLLSQSTSGNQVAIPAPDAGANGQLSMTHISASLTNYASNRAPASWVFLQNTTTEFYACIKINTSTWNRVWGTMNQIATNRGWLLAATSEAGGSSSNAWSQYVGNASGTYRAVCENAASSAGTGVYRQISSRHVSGVSINVVSPAGDVAGTVNGPGDGADPNTTMNFGTIGGVGSAVSVVFFGWFPALTAIQRALVQRYIYARYGVPP